MKKIIPLLIIFLISLNVAYASTCSSLASNYTLDSNVTSTTDCFYIGNNVVLDCAGYSIIFDTSNAGGKGAYCTSANGCDNNTIKNCNFVYGSNHNDSYAIYFEVGDDLQITNNTFTNSSEDQLNLVVEEGDNDYIYLNEFDNEIEFYGNNSQFLANKFYGDVEFYDVNGTTVEYNTFYDNSSLVTNTVNADYLEVSHNTFTGGYFVMRFESDYVDVASNGFDNSGTEDSITFKSVNGSVTYNTIASHDVSSTGILVSGGSGNLIQENHITTYASSTGLSLYLTTDNTLRFNDITSTGGYSILDDGDGENSFIWESETTRGTWNDKDNLTTTASIDYNNFVSSTSFFGISDSSTLSNYNTSANIVFLGQYYDPDPQLFKNGVRCDNDPSLCNISYDSVNGVIYANVSSFSNYTTTDFPDYVSDCGVINESSILTTNINSSLGCIVINQSNIYLDCNSNSITYSQGGVGYGISLGEDIANVTIMNCEVIQSLNEFTAQYDEEAYGIYLEGGDNIVVEDSEVTTLGEISPSFYLNDCYDCWLENNIMNTYGAESEGVLFESCEDSGMESNNILSKYATPIWVDGMTEVDYDLNISETNVVELANGSTAPIYYLYNESDVIFTTESIGQLFVTYSENITVDTAHLYFAGIVNIFGDDFSVLDSTFDLNYQNDYLISLGSNNTIFDDNTFQPTQNVTWSFIISETDENPTITDNLFETSSDEVEGILLIENIGTATIENNYMDFDGSDTVGIVLENITYVDMTNNFMTLGTSGVAIEDDGLGLKDLTFESDNTQARWWNLTNTTVLGSLDSSSLNFNTNIIEISDGSGYENLHSEGRLIMAGLTQYNFEPILLKNGVACNDSECNTTWSESSHQITSYVSSFSNYTTVGEYGCGDISTSITLNNSVIANGSCFNIIADDITLDCDGHSITFGTQNSLGEVAGITIDGYNRVTVSNCEIYSPYTNGTTEKAGIKLSDADGNHFNGNDISVNGDDSNIGIDLYNATSNVFNDNDMEMEFQHSSQGFDFYSSNSNQILSSDITLTNLAETHLAISSGMQFYLSDSNLIGTSTIFTNGTFDNMKGLLLITSDSNSFSSVTIGATGSQALLINDDCDQNSFTNVNFYGLEGVIEYSIGISAVESLFRYYNSYGDITWDGINDITNDEDNFNIGNSVVLENNTIGFNTNADNNNFNSSATITFNDLPYEQNDTIWVLKDGIRCDNNPALCVIGDYNGTTGILDVNVSGFSNYTTTLAYLQFFSNNYSNGINTSRFDITNGMYITIDDSLTEAHIDGIIPVNTTTGDETYIESILGIEGVSFNYSLNVLLVNHSDTFGDTDDIISVYQEIGDGVDDDFACGIYLNADGQYYLWNCWENSTMDNCADDVNISENNVWADLIMEYDSVAETVNCTVDFGEGNSYSSKIDMPLEVQGMTLSYWTELFNDNGLNTTGQSEVRVDDIFYGGTLPVEDVSYLEFFSNDYASGINTSRFDITNGTYITMDDTNGSVHIDGTVPPNLVDGDEAYIKSNLGVEGVSFNYSINVKMVNTSTGFGDTDDMLSVYQEIGDGFNDDFGCGVDLWEDGHYALWNCWENSTSDNCADDVNISENNPTFDLVMEYDSVSETINCTVEVQGGSTYSSKIDMPLDVQGMTLSYWAETFNDNNLNTTGEVEVTIDDIFYGGALPEEECYCNGNYCGGDWNVIGEITCEDEVILATGDITISDVSEREGLYFIYLDGNIQELYFEMGEYDTDLTDEIPDGIINSVHTDNLIEYPFSTLIEMYATADISENRMEFYGNPYIPELNQTLFYVIDVDNNFQSVVGGNGSVSGFDVGFLYSGGVVSGFCVNSTDVSGLTIVPSGTTCNGDYDGNITSDTTIYYDVNEDNYIEFLIDTNGTWTDKPMIVGSVDSGSPSGMIFVNRTLNSSGFGQLNLVNTTIIMSDISDFRVSAGLDMSDSELFLNQTSDGNSRVYLELGSKILFEESLMNSSHRYGLSISTRNMSIQGSQWSNYGSDGGDDEFRGQFDEVRNIYINDSLFTNCPDTDSTGFGCISLSGSVSNFLMENSVIQDNDSDNIGILIEGVFQEAVFRNNEIYNSVKAYFSEEVSTVNSTILFDNNSFETCNGIDLRHNPDGSETEYQGLTLLNNDWTQTCGGNETSYNILDNGTFVNTMIYNSSDGQIVWKVENMSFYDKLALGTGVFVGDNLLGFDSTVVGNQNYNTTAELTFWEIPYNANPQLCTNTGGVLSDCVSCNGDNDCIYTLGIATADVGHFSNYSINGSSYPNDINLISPINYEEWNESSTVTFTYMVNGTEDFENCTVYIDTVESEADLSVTLDVNETIDVTGISDGVHSWNIICNDLVGNEVYSYLDHFTMNYTAVPSTPTNNVGSIEVYSNTNLMCPAGSHQSGLLCIADNIKLDIMELPSMDGDDEQESGIVPLSIAGVGEYASGIAGNVQDMDITTVIIIAIGIMTLLLIILISVVFQKDRR